MESTSLAKTSEKESPATCSSTATNSVSTSTQGKGTRLLRFRNNVIPAGGISDIPFVFFYFVLFLNAIFGPSMHYILEGLASKVEPCSLPYLACFWHFSE